jgi:hypothetical protein
MADPTQAPFRQKIITFTTPRVEDIMVSEMRTTTRESVPEYGTPHPDKKLYPHHVLSYVSPADESGLWRTYVYVAKREKQDLYNWSHSVADIGGTKFDAVVRAYVTLRSEFTPNTPTMGAKMPNVPVDLFGTGTGTPSVIAGYVLADRKQEKIQDKELDSVFVVEQQVFVKKVTLAEVKFDPQTGRANDSSTTLYYRGEEVTTGVTIESLMADSTDAYWGLQSDGSFRSCQALSANWFAVKTDSVIPSDPVNSEENPAKQRKITRTTPLGTDVVFSEVGTMPDPAPSYGDVHYDTDNWPDHKLVLIKPADETGLLYEFFYAADLASQDDYNFEIQGGEQLVRTYVVPRSLYFERPVGDPAAITDEFLFPPAGAESPDSRFAKYCFADDECREADQILTSRYVVIRRRFIRPLTVDYVFDDSLQRIVSITKEVIPLSSDPPDFSAVGAGVSVEIQDGNRFHNVKITKAIVLNEGESYPYALPSIPGSRNVNFPSKLISVSLVLAWAWADSVTAAQSYSEDYYFKYIIREARPGPYSAIITRYITDNPAALQAAHPIFIIPQPVRETIAVTKAWYHASLKGNSTFAVAKEVLVPATIHQAITITDGSGASLAQMGSVTSTLAATPGVTAFLAASTAVVDFEVRQLAMGLFEVSVVTLDISSLYA